MMRKLSLERTRFAEEVQEKLGQSTNNTEAMLRLGSAGAAYRMARRCVC